VDVLVSFKDKPGKSSRSSALSFRARYSSKPGAKAKTLTRSYTISLVAIDLAGNESRAETTVVVPHNPGKGQPR